MLRMLSPQPHLRLFATRCCFVPTHTSGTCVPSAADSLTPVHPPPPTTTDGDDVCPGGKTLDCVPTIAAAIAAANTGGTTTNATGVSMTGSSTDPATMAKALAVAKAADVVVLALGIDKSVEHEGVDRSDITLPGMQAAFAKAVYKLGKPVVLVLTNGGPLAIDDLVDGAGAIVEAFNPAFGAPMLAATLFGAENRWGKLPYTIYPAVYVCLVILVLVL